MGKWNRDIKNTCGGKGHGVEVKEGTVISELSVHLGPEIRTNLLGPFTPESGKWQRYMAELSGKKSAKIPYLNSRANFSSVTSSVPRLSALLYFFNVMFLNVKCRVLEIVEYSMI